MNNNNNNNSNCYYCYSCDYCDDCNNCNYCYACDDCNNCYYCYSCKYSVNLRMSEYQLFCYAEELDRASAASNQQKPFRVFNVEVSEEEHVKIIVPIISLDFDQDLDPSTRYQTAFGIAWRKLTQQQQQKFFDIPHFDWEIFTKITGVEKEVENPPKKMTQAQIEAELGYKVTIIE